MLKAIFSTLHQFIEKKTWERVIWLCKFKRKEERTNVIAKEDYVPTFIITTFGIVSVIIYKMRTEFFGYLAQLFGFR